MSRVFKGILLGAGVVLVALILLARVRYPGKAPMRLSPESCDARLWDHVYGPERLRVVEKCTAVEGRVVSIHGNSDGDLHIDLDPDQKAALNLLNVIHGHGHLIVELICDHPPTYNDAKAACVGFTSNVGAPSVGSRVRVIGAYVTDRGNGWNEIHPVTRIDSLP